MLVVVVTNVLETESHNILNTIFDKIIFIKDAMALNVVKHF